ncbi:hypothetical protein PFNF135_02142 [Plasmodium falciparum NF135/5.C10]|uniref:Uncharacterized protein n=1 Tax=Plasmodium falciparum NF135/5.C10 TaxID=1036726 RepID=W4IIH2_PLAFA|nr:hypothetical protein PFNF135_02142 [Plasmodium falciparum NF135/5.C10]
MSYHKLQLNFIFIKLHNNSHDFYQINNKKNIFISFLLLSRYSILENSLYCIYYFMLFNYTITIYK